MPRKPMRRIPIARPPITRPLPVKNTNMARMGRKPSGAMAVPEILTNPGRTPRPIGALPAGAKPRNVFWSRIPVVRTLMNWFEWIFFPKAHLRRMQRKRVGTGVSIRDRLSQSRRSKPLSKKQQVQSLRNRMSGLTATKALQHQRNGVIKGLPKYPGKKAA